MLVKIFYTITSYRGCSSVLCLDLKRVKGRLSEIIQAGISVSDKGGTKQVIKQREKKEKNYERDRQE